MASGKELSWQRWVRKVSKVPQTRRSFSPKFSTKPTGPDTASDKGDKCGGKCRASRWCTICVTTAGCLRASTVRPGAGFFQTTHSKMLPSLKRLSSEVSSPHRRRKAWAASSSWAEGPRSMTRSKFSGASARPSITATPSGATFCHRGRGWPMSRTAARTQRSPSPASMVVRSNSASAIASGASLGTALAPLALLESVLRSGHRHVPPSCGVRRTRSQASSGAASRPKTASKGSAWASKIRSARWASQQSSSITGPRRQKKFKAPAAS
mmetsp:Transcript_4351/g.10442  ORF Transcript_4351/g.10442 Transcript_4351/m.10442 type:complete len:268 (-) Transcript_4351:47-850(-)